MPTAGGADASPTGCTDALDAAEPSATAGGRTTAGRSPAATSAAGAVTRRTAPGRSTRPPWASVGPVPERACAAMVDVAGTVRRRATPTRSVAAKVSGERVVEPIAGGGAAQATPLSKRRMASLAVGCRAGSPPRHCGPATTGRRCTARVGARSRSKRSPPGSRTASSGSSSSVLPAAKADADPASGGGWLNRFGRGWCTSPARRPKLLRSTAPGAPAPSSGAERPLRSDDGVGDPPSNLAIAAANAAALPSAVSARAYTSAARATSLRSSRPVDEPAAAGRPRPATTSFELPDAPDSPNAAGRRAAASGAAAAGCGRRVGDEGVASVAWLSLRRTRASAGCSRRASEVGPVIGPEAVTAPRRAELGRPRRTAGCAVAAPAPAVHRRDRRHPRIGTDQRGVRIVGLLRLRPDALGQSHDLQPRPRAGRDRATRRRR